MNLVVVVVCSGVIITTIKTISMAVDFVFTMLLLLIRKCVSLRYISKRYSL